MVRLTCGPSRLIAEIIRSLIRDTLNDLRLPCQVCSKMHNVAPEIGPV